MGLRLLLWTEASVVGLRLQLWIEASVGMRLLLWTEASVVMRLLLWTVGILCSGPSRGGPGTQQVADSHSLFLLLLLFLFFLPKDGPT